MMLINKSSAYSTAIAILYCCLMSFGLSCANQNSSYYSYENPDKSLLIIVPNPWIFHGDSDELKKFNPNLLYIGRDANNGCFVEEKKVVSISNPDIRYYLNNELFSVKAKNPGATILSTQIGSLQSSVVINYKNTDHNKEYYFSHAVFIRPSRHIILNFKGLDTSNFRIEVDKIVKSTIVKNN